MFYNFSTEDNVWNEEGKTFIDRKVTYRSQVDGRCTFGALRARNATWSRQITMNSGVRNISKKGDISHIDGAKIFGAWKANSKCDSLDNIQEPSAFPPIPPKQIHENQYVSNKNEMSEIP